MSEVAFLVGEVVVDVRDGGRIVFELGDGPAPRLYADVANAVCIDEHGAPLPLSRLVGRSIEATSTEAGVLGLVFRDGATLRCEPNPVFEAWEVVGGSPQGLVVCEPGGELAVWDERHVPSREEAEHTVDEIRRVLGWNVRIREITERGSIIVEPEPSSED
jgi:Family of unknown function (DUF6188)